jgi:hypothetical protein
MDRTLLEYSPELEAFEAHEFEAGTLPLTGGTDSAGVFRETEELELAAELLEATDERKLNRFLLSLIAKVERAVGRSLSSPVKVALGIILQSAAKKMLPMLNRVPGAQSGGQLASVASRFFGLELEGLSPEDKEFEIAKSFVRFAAAAVRNALNAPLAAEPRTLARKAIVQSAQRHAPGMLSDSSRESKQTARWYRQGRNIIVVF